MRSDGKLHGGGVSSRSSIRLPLAQIEDIISSSCVVTALDLALPSKSTGNANTCE